MDIDVLKILKMDFKDYVLKFHSEIVKTLEVGLKGEEPDITALAEVLRNYGPAYAFLVTQHRLIKNVFLQANSEYEEEYEKSYVEAISECGSKATAKIIAAKVTQLYGEGLKDLKNKRDDLEQKTKLASDMIQVFDRTINALQSLGKLMVSDFFASRLT